VSFDGHPEKKSSAYILYGFCTEIFIHFWKSDTFKVGGRRDLMEYGKKIQKAENTR